MMRLASALVVTSLVLLGCPSKDSQSSSGGTSPSGASSGSGTGPLANLESAPFANEVWIGQDGTQQQFLYYAQQNVRVSAQCRNPAGQMNCEALRQLRGAAPVELSKKTLTGGISAGTRACTKLGKRLWPGHNQSGAEDGFCVFGDGSMLSTGALEQYGLRVID